jgi:carboxyl-terminal processing protease
MNFGITRVFVFCTTWAFCTVALLTTTRAAADAALPALAQAQAAATTSSTSAAPAQGQLPLEDLRLFTQVYEQIRQNYVEAIDDKTLLQYAIEGMLDKLDPHSAYLDQSSFDDLQVNTNGEFGGIGIEVSQEEGQLTVVSPIDDTPASKAGIEAGDIVIQLDDTLVKDLSLDEAVEKMRGPQGTALRMILMREGLKKPLELTLIRDLIKVKSVRSELLEDHYGYLRIAQFQTRTGTDLLEALHKLRGENTLKGLILDLRNNPGGVLQASVEVAGLFLNGERVVYTEGRQAEMNESFYAEAGDRALGLPLVVLINDGSASASEIVAGALQDHQRAVIMGTRSFGKGSVQTVQPISQNKAIKLTTARYFTPNGRSIQAQGIEPDIVVERVKVTAVQARRGATEAELKGHLGNATGQEVSRKRREAEANEALESLQSRDNQLYEAVNLLKGLNILKTHSRKAAATPP